MFYPNGETVRPPPHILPSERSPRRKAECGRTGREQGRRCNHRISLYAQDCRFRSHLPPGCSPRLVFRTGVTPGSFTGNIITLHSSNWPKVARGSSSRCPSLSLSRDHHIPHRLLIPHAGIQTFPCPWQTSRETTAGAGNSLLFLKAETGEPFVELGKLPPRIHQPMHTGPRRVGFGVDVKTQDISRSAIGGTGLELGPVGHDDYDFMVIGVNSILHGQSPRSRVFRIANRLAPRKADLVYRCNGERKTSATCLFAWADRHGRLYWSMVVKREENMHTAIHTISQHKCFRR